MTKNKPHASGVLVLVLALVNGAAVWGQAGWALDNIVPAGWVLAAALSLSLAFAAAIELIGVFLAMMADQGEDVGLPSGGVRLGSYAVGLVSGSLNFSHWLHTGVAAAIAFGFLSAVSPFLWGIWSRVRRGRLSPPSRRFWHPIRSVSLIRDMAWHGQADENEAVRRLSAPVATDRVTLPDGSVAMMSGGTLATTDTPAIDMTWTDDGHGHEASDCADTAAIPVSAWEALRSDEPDVVATRPQGDLDAWERGYEDALSTLGQQMAAEAQAHLSALSATDTLPRRTRTVSGTSVPEEFVAMVKAWDVDALSRADMVRLSAAYFGVSTRTVRRWLATLPDSVWTDAGA